MDIQQYYGALIGSACGDVLGRACEFMYEKKITDYYGSKVTEFQPDRLGVFEFGEYTDDTYLMKCIADSLIENEGYNLNDISNNFIHWYKTNGKDCGNMTNAAISLMIDGFEPLDSGKHAWELSGKRHASNGGLMRNTAIPLAYANNFDKMLEATELCCKITHFDNRCVLSCLAHSIAIHAILHNNNVFNTVWAYCGERDSEFDNLLYEARDSKISDFKLDGSGQGYTYLSLKVALCAILNYDSFSEPIIEIVNKGGDSDTNACIAGSLLGAKYGLSSIPMSWKSNLLAYEDLCFTADALYNLSSKL